jgi:hypothetical protein
MGSNPQSTLQQNSNFRGYQNNIIKLYRNARVRMALLPDIGQGRGIRAEEFLVFVWIATGAIQRTLAPYVMTDRRVR